MINNPEFYIGQEVTFDAYGIPCRCKVVGYRHGMDGTGTHLDGTPDDRVFYSLRGQATTTCSGLCIRESKYFEPHEDRAPATY